MGLVVGPSNGWLYALQNYKLADHLDLIQKARGNAMEVVLTGYGIQDERYKSVALGPSLSLEDRLDFSSVHLPHYQCRSQVELEKEVGGLLLLLYMQPFNVAVIHPLKQRGEYPQAYFNGVRSVIPLSIENMDKNQNGGSRISELKSLVALCDLGFVLDVQHAFEWDDSMVYAWELFYAFEDKITHYHVSGQQENSNHSLVCRAENRDEILGFMAEAYLTKPAPIILEGLYGKAEDLVEEIKCLSDALFVCS